MTALDLLAGYRAKRFTPSDVVEDVIAALERTDAACNIVVTDLYDSARAEAKRATDAYRTGEARGALAGVPVTIKDLLFVAGVPAHAGAPSLKDFVPQSDSAAVERLKAAGAVLTCKTTTCESGYKLTADSPLTGITRNPWDLSRTSGGSSGGAAAAVAAGCGPLGVGTDAVGSIRVPASFCGVFGIKPTFGLVPRAPGFFPPSWGSLAHTGPIARTVADAALMLEVIAGFDARDAVSLPQPPRKFLDRSRQAGRPAHRLHAGLGLCGRASRGARVVLSRRSIRCRLRRDAGAAAARPRCRHSGTRAEADRLHRAGGRGRSAPTGGAGAVGTETFRDVVATGPQLQRHRPCAGAASPRGAAQHTARHVQRMRSRHHADRRRDGASRRATLGVDEIDGKPVDKHLGWSPFSWPINLAGLPAASVPCGFDSAGLPIGLQLVGPMLGEPVLIRVAAAFEAARPWAGKRPSFAGAAH